MGCNCRKSKKLYNALTNRQENEENDGISVYFSRFFQAVFLLVIILIMLPFILLYLFVSYVAIGSFIIRFPKKLTKILA